MQEDHFCCDVCSSLCALGSMAHLDCDCLCCACCAHEHIEVNMKPQQVAAAPQQPSGTCLQWARRSATGTGTATWCQQWSCRLTGAFNPHSTAFAWLTQLLTRFGLQSSHAFCQGRQACSKASQQLPARGVAVQ